MSLTSNVLCTNPLSMTGCATNASTRRHTTDSRRATMLSMKRSLACQVVDQHAAIRHRRERRSIQPPDYRLDIALPVLVEARKVRRRVGQQTRRQRNRDTFDHFGSPEHCVHQRPAGTSVSIGERVNSLELGMRDGNLRENWKIGSRREHEKIIQRRRQPIMMRWNECGVVRTDVGATDPDLLCVDGLVIPQG